LINLLNSLGEQGVAALIIVFAVIVVYRKLEKELSTRLEIFDIKETKKN
jgi:hypothetical protein